MAKHRNPPGVPSKSKLLSLFTHSPQIHIKSSSQISPPIITLTLQPDTLHLPSPPSIPFPTNPPPVKHVPSSVLPSIPSHATLEMGNICTCLSQEDVTKQPPKRLCQRSSSAPARWSRIRSSRRENTNVKFDDPVLHEQALAAAAIILQQHRGNGNGSLPFDRSASLRYPISNGSSSKKQSSLPRCYSSRARSSTDPLLQPHQLVNQDSKLDGLETYHFVLVHGGGFGAWCWYKTIALLEEGGFKVTAIDLMGSGIHSFDTNKITSLSQYAKPLGEFLERLAEGEKVILVGHDLGGACISYAMEMFPSKVSKAIFVAAAMLSSGQSVLDIFSQQADSKDLMQEAQIFLYANGNNHPPTAIDLDKSLLKELLFNQSPTKDVALASVSMRPIPFAPILEKFTLSDTNYGYVRRFYIQTTEDNAMPMASQERMVKASPPEQVFRLKGSDHSPFFSKPQALHKLLVEISKIP